MGDAIFEERSRKTEILIKDLTEILRTNGVAPATATSAVRTLRNELRKSGEFYIKERNNSYWSLYNSGEITRQELKTLIAYLALYAQSIYKGRMAEGTLTQNWRIDHAKGIHPAIPHLAALATGDHIKTIDPFMLNHFGTTPHELFDLLVEWLCWHYKMIRECADNGDFICLSSSSALRAGLEEGNMNFSIQLETGVAYVGLSPFHRDASSGYEVKFRWSSITTKVNPSFRTEELIARCQAFGTLTLDLPLLTAPAQKTA